MKKIAQRIFDKTAGLGISDVEVFIESNKELSTRVRNGEIEAIETAMPVGMGVRLIKDQRQGFSYTTDLNDLMVVERALSSAEFVEQDRCFAIPAADDPGQQRSDLQLYDSRAAQLTTSDCLQYSIALEDLIYQQDKRIKKTESVGFFTTISEDYLFNSNGAELYQQKSLLGASGEVVAQDNGQSEAGSGFRMYRSLADYDPQLIARETAEDAVNLLGAQGIKSGRRQIILPAMVARQFLGIFSQSFMADNYQKSKSAFNGRMGGKILSQDLTIIDDSLLKKGLGSAYFDGEGVSGKKTVLVNEGRFESLLYDSYTAIKDNVKSTGNGHRNFKSVPGVAVNNFYLSFKKQTDDLFKGFTGLVITRVMGLHTANPITGDFSFGSSGYWMDGGERQYGIRNMAVAGNLKDLFNKIEQSEKETLFIGHVGCPGLKINDINIAGE